MKRNRSPASVYQLLNTPTTSAAACQPVAA